MSLGFAAASSQEAACSSLGVLHCRRGRHAKAKEIFERNFVISRKVVNDGKGPATTGTGLRGRLEGRRFRRGPPAPLRAPSHRCL